MNRVIPIIFGLFILSFSAEGQKVPKSKPDKPKVLGTVTVVAPPYEPPNYPHETEPGLWKEVSSSNGGIRVTMPTGSGKYLFDDSIVLSDGNEALSISASTKNAVFKITTRPAGLLQGNRDIEAYLESMIRFIEERPIATLRSKKNVYYGSQVGREIVILNQMAEQTEIQIARLFVLNSTLVVLEVIVDESTDMKNIEPWINKFFESLVVPLPTINEV